MSKDDFILTCLFVTNQMKEIAAHYNLISYAIETLPLEMKMPLREKLQKFAETGPEFFTELQNQKEKYLHVLSTQNRKGNSVGHGTAA